MKSKQGRYICFDGKISLSELLSVRAGVYAYFKEDEIHDYRWTKWITIPVARSKLLMVLYK